MEKNGQCHGRIKDFSRGMAGILGLQNQWGLPQNAANQELESNLKLLHQKYKQYHKVEITMRYLSRVLFRFF